MIKDFDVLVVGAGLVGMSSALALSRQGMSVGLLESKPCQPLATGEYAEEDWDSRIYAISPANAEWLADLGVWHRLDTHRVSPIAQMQIFGDAGHSHLQFDSMESNVDELGFILESRHLESALLAALMDSSVRLINGVVAESATFDQQQAEICLADQRRLRAQLLVAADGANSWLRGQAGIHVSIHDYQQTAVVANFAVEISHHNVAYQWFSERGVLAWLPLPGNRMSIVWSAEEKFAEELLELKPELLSEEVARQGGLKLGALSVLTEACGFPLRQRTADSLVRPGLVLIGDAAHTVHPLAGQGVNLGFRDVKVLVDVLQGRHARQSYGDLMLLRRYERARKWDMLAMKSVTRGLVELFAHHDELVKQLRNWGLSLTNHQTKIKKYLAHQAIH